VGIRVTVFPAQAIRDALEASTPQRVRIANEIVAIAQPEAPSVTGAYKGAYGVEQDGDRVSAVNNDPDAAYIVFGTEDTPPHDELLEASKQFGKYTGWEVRG
jgi:hypothetical protein